MPRVRTLIPILLALLAWSCNSAPKEPDPNWVSSEIAVSSDSTLWQVILLALHKMEFPKSAEMDRANMSLVSGWKIELSPWKGRGTRQRAEVSCTPVGPGRWQVETRVATQINQALARPMDYSYAEWEWVPDDGMTARILMQHIHSYFQRDIQLSEPVEDPIREALGRPARP